MSWDATPAGLIAILDHPKWGVARQCQAVEDCILANSDNLRGFFEQCFPTLLKRLFGYDGTSWLNLVARSPKEADAKALLKLLSPAGILFTAMYSADADGATQFFFPRERLPTHTQMLLAAPAGRQELERWPQYQRGAIVADAAGRCHVKLGVFQFFLFWFAFYVIKGDGGGMDSQLRPQAAGLTNSVRKAADVLHLTRGRESEAMQHPYLAALRQLLLELLPRPTTAAQLNVATTPAKVGGSPFFRTPATSAKRQADGATRGATFYNVLLEFWIADGDEPVPLAVAPGGGPLPGQAVPNAPMWGTSYEPPSEDLLEALTELVKYATLADSGKRQPAQAGAPWLPMAQLHTLLPPALAAQRGGGGAAAAVPAILAGPSRLGAAAQPAAQAFSRRLYRFFRRALTLWPEQRSIKPLLRCLLAFLAPWRASSAAPMLLPGAAASAPGHSHLASHLTAQVTDLVHRVHWADGGNKADGSGRQGGGGGYGPQWEAHVLSNLPFYLALLPLFLEASLPRVEVRGESAAQDLVNMVGVLEAAPELRDLLQRVERDFNKYAAAQPRRADGAFAELLPWLLEQTQDWEVAATANCVGATPLVRATPGFALFSTAAGGAAYVARDLLDLSSHIFKPEVQRRLRQCLEAALPLGALPAAAAEAGRAVEEGEARYHEAVPRLPKSSWRDVQYKGDPMLRPIASFEIGPLVRLLVAISMRLNGALGLGGRYQQQQRQVGQGEVEDAGEGEEAPPEHRVQEALARLRRRGARINLRPLADLRNLAWIPIAYFVLYHALRLAAWAVLALLAGPGEGAAGGGGGEARHRQQERY